MINAMINASHFLQTLNTIFPKDQSLNNYFQNFSPNIFCRIFVQVTDKYK